MVRLVIHAPTLAALARARGNLANLLKAEPNCEVELVVNGEAAVEIVRNPDLECARHCVVCENSLRSANLVCPPGLRMAEAAVLHIARRQAEGWGYWRA